MEGPVISASRIPTLQPFLRIILARDAVTIDFPTPPLPLTTPITFLISENSFAGFLKSTGLLLQESACAHPAQSDGEHPFCCCSSAIISTSHFKISRAKLPLLSTKTLYAADYSTTAITSTSQSTFFGNVFTATQLLAGLEVKYFAYTSLNAAKSPISARKQVVFKTLS